APHGTGYTSSVGLTATWPTPHPIPESRSSMFWSRKNAAASPSLASVPEVSYDGPLISLRNVEKCYVTPAGRSYVLRQVSLDVQPGEFVTIMGPSGAGKSTLLGMLGMFDSDWEGEFWFQGEPVHKLS